jgi:hypothetical protein
VRTNAEEERQYKRGSELLMSQACFMKHRDEFKPAFRFLLYLYFNKLTEFDLYEVGKELGFIKPMAYRHYTELLRKGLIEQKSKIKTFVEIRFLIKFY